MHAHVLTTLLFLGAVTTTGAVFSASDAEGLRVAVPVQWLDDARSSRIERVFLSMESELDAGSRIFSDVDADTQRGLVTLSIADGRSLRLGQLERELGAAGVRIRSERFELGEVHLCIAGTADAATFESLHGALTAELFAAADVRVDGDPQRIAAEVVPGAERATLAATADAVRASAPGLHLIDAVWTNRADD